MAGDGDAALDPRPWAAYFDNLAPVAQRDRAGGDACNAAPSLFTPRKLTACKTPEMPGLGRPVQRHYLAGWALCQAEVSGLQKRFVCCFCAGGRLL